MEMQGTDPITGEPTIIDVPEEKLGQPSGLVVEEAEEAKSPYEIHLGMTEAKFNKLSAKKKEALLLEKGVTIEQLSTETSDENEDDAE